MGIMYEALKKLNAECLTEDYEHWARKNYPNLFGDNSGKDPKEVSKILVALAKIDPNTKERVSDKQILTSQQGPYMQWIIRALKNSSYEDFMRLSHEYSDQLEIFDDLKKRNRLPADKRDIMKYQTLDDLMQMLNGLGAGHDISHHSDFKQDISNIREGLQKICELPDESIPSDIKTVGDVMTLVCENDKWEVWKAKNVFATMLFDAWGAGAGWCVGGGSQRGVKQLDSAKSFFNNYNAGGTAHYVCFQQKAIGASRPTNKYLITLGEGGSLPQNSAGYQFNDSNNHTQYADGYSQDSQMQALSDFLQKEGLVDAFKNSEYGGCACFLNIENDQRLANGEPYRYVGGQITDKYRQEISKIFFIDSEGKDRIVDVKAHPEFFDCVSISEMTNMDNLIKGEPYVYDGSTKRVPMKFRKLVKEVVVPDTYELTTGAGIGIPQAAFLGCDNMIKCTFPKQVGYLGIGCFRVGGFKSPYTDIQVWTEKHHIELASNDDFEWLVGMTPDGKEVGPRHLFYIGQDSPTEADRIISGWRQSHPQPESEEEQDAE